MAARDTQSWRCFLSSRQHSDFTLNFAAIIHTQKDVSGIQKNLNRLLHPEPYAFVFCRLLWACDDSNHLTSCC